MIKKALITGITGQDGAYLSKLLLEKGYEVYGAFRRTSDLNMGRMKFLGIDNNIEFVPLELLEFTNIQKTLEAIKPDEVYNLGAQSFVALSFEQPIFTADVTGLGVLRMLEAIRAVNPQIRFYQASSSEMFGKVRETPQNEQTPFHPRSPYAASKLFGHCMAVNYRESYDMFACSGILFNHESPLRGLEFVTRKVTHAVARIKLRLQEKLSLGNLDSMRDWGYAAEYVEAMWLMLQQSRPDDYVIATGETHSVREFVVTAFREAGIELEWTGHGIHEKGVERATGKTLVEIAPQFFRPAEVDVLTGDYSKAKAKLGWEPKTTFNDLVKIMVHHDISITEKG
ncbi:MAG: GDP-mannose 4,6-dehydratase [Dissulfurispiraceae bacterium]